MNAIPDPILRALADRPVSRICEQALLMAHERDIEEILTQCAKGRKISYYLQHMEPFPGVKHVIIAPKDLSISVYFNGPVQINGMTLTVRQTFPEAVKRGLRKHGPRMIVDHPLLDGLKITKLEDSGNLCRIGLKSKTRRRTLGEVLAEHPDAVAKGWRAPD